MEKTTSNLITKPRYDWLDAIKAFAMMLVIFGHLGVSTVTTYQAYASFIKLPLFFAASGFVFSVKKTEKPLVFIADRIKRIILPYLYLCTIIQIFYLIYEKQEPKAWIVSSLSKIFTGSIYMWFLPVIFLCNVMMLVVFKIFKEKDGAIISIAVVSLILGYFLLPEKHIIFDVNEALIAFAFCVFGFYYKKYIVKADKRIIIPIASVCLVLYLALPLVYKRITGHINYVNMYENHYTNFFLDMLISFSGVMAVFVFASLFKYPKSVLWFGKNTMFYYAFHIPMYYTLYSLFQTLLPAIPIWNQKGSKRYVALSCVITVISVLVLAPFCNLVNKYIPFLVGGKKNLRGKNGH
jgi:fucose 4-O-acetylase-like acetyltransferase